jgi:hypothetical protein
MAMTSKEKTNKYFADYMRQWREKNKEKIKAKEEARKKEDELIEAEVLEKLKIIYQQRLNPTT